MAEKVSFREGILKNIANTLAKYQTYAPVPPADSSSETRGKEKEQPRGTGFGASAQKAGVWYDEQMQIDQSRIAKYADYKLMDTEDPELASALDIYADNATKGENETDVVIHIATPVKKIAKILNETIKRANLDHQLWSITRELVKSGDVFEELVCYDDKEIHRLKHLDESKMVVVTDEYGRKDAKYPYVQKNEVGGIEASFEDWQIVHFKMGKDRSSKYGVDGSVLAPLRKLYRQLNMLEDSVVLARLTRAIQRYAYLIDTEGIEPGDPTLEYLESVKKTMRKRRTIDPVTGKMDLEYNPMSLEEDIFIATKEGSKANVKVLQGATNLGVLSDIEYFRNKKFAGVKVPKAYLSHEKDVRARAMITEQDVQFARTVRRVQLALVEGLKKIFNHALAVRGIDPTKVTYEIQLPALSTIDELRVWQVKQLKVNVASMLHRDLKVSLHWILINLLDYDQEEVEKIIAYMDDKKSFDNKVFDKQVKNQERMFKNKDKDDDPSRLFRKEPPKGGKVPSKKDREDPKDRKPDEREPREDLLTPEEIETIRENLGGDIESLKDIFDWVIDSRLNEE